MRKLNRKLENGDYEIVIPSYLRFLNALLKNINHAAFDSQPDGCEVYLSKEAIGMAVKDAIEASRKEVTP